MVRLVYRRLRVLRQRDRKGYVAFRRIAHMAVVTVGLF